MSSLEDMPSPELMLPFSFIPRREDIWFLLIFAISLVGVLIPKLRLKIWRPRRDSVEPNEATNSDRLDDLRPLRDRHEVASCVIDLFEKDGAGAWPPKANHDSWPSALLPYKNIYLELVPLLHAAEPSLDDDVNNTRRQNYRSLMRKLLKERINTAQVQTILAAVEAGDWDLFPRDAYNGFYSCVAVCRHAYRWATIPVVRVAQQEKIVEFPPELDVPWPYLQRNYGMTADSGNNTANVLHNFNERGERVYKINVGMSDLIQSSEEAFFRMFYDLEVMAFPIYHEMVRAIVSFEKGEKASCSTSLESISQRLRHLLLIFFEGMTDSRVSRSVWLSYIQGFQGWGVGKMLNGEFVKYDGLSGNHVLFFQALDAFLGMDRYLPDENHMRYIPKTQRDLCRALRKHSFRTMLKDRDDREVEAKMSVIVNQLKVFRAAHRARVMPYLEQPAPERLAMTAGKSVLEGATPEETKEALRSLDQMLVKRLKETV